MNHTLVNLYSFLFSLYVPLSLSLFPPSLLFPRSTLLSSFGRDLPVLLSIIRHLGTGRTPPDVLFVSCLRVPERFPSSRSLSFSLSLTLPPPLFIFPLGSLFSPPRPRPLFAYSAEPLEVTTRQHLRILTIHLEIAPINRAATMLGSPARV